MGRSFELEPHACCPEEQRLREDEVRSQRQSRGLDRGVGAGEPVLSREIGEERLLDRARRDLERLGRASEQDLAGLVTPTRRGGSKERLHGTERTAFLGGTGALPPPPRLTDLDRVAAHELVDRGSLPGRWPEQASDSLHVLAGPERSTDDDGGPRRALAGRPRGTLGEPRGARRGRCRT